MAKFLKNKTVLTKTYQGRSFAPDVFVEIPDSSIYDFANDLEILADIIAGNCAMSSDGSTEIVDKSEQINFLKGMVLAAKDADGALLSRVKTTKAGWHYEPRSINFVTGKPSSHYNRRHNGGSIMAGTDYGDAILRFWNASDVELIKGVEESDVDFQTRVASDCTKSCLDWHPTYSMEIVGGMLQIFEPPTTDAYMWAIIAPDIPEAYGGSVPFLAGGFNLKFFKSGSIEHYDGRSAKLINPDFVYHSSKFRIVVKHEVGVQIGIQVYFEHFRA